MIHCPPVDPFWAVDIFHWLMRDLSPPLRQSEVIVFPYLSMYDPFSSGGSILGSGFLALVDEGTHCKQISRSILHGHPHVDF